MRQSIRRFIDRVTSLPLPFRRSQLIGYQAGLCRARFGDDFLDRKRQSCSYRVIALHINGYPLAANVAATGPYVLIEIGEPATTSGTRYKTMRIGANGLCWAIVRKQLCGPIDYTASVAVCAHTIGMDALPIFGCVFREESRSAVALGARHSNGWIMVIIVGEQRQFVEPTAGQLNWKAARSRCFCPASHLRNCLKM